MMMMIAPLPDPPGQVMTMEQQADLDCLIFAKALKDQPPSLPKSDAEAMERAFLDRLHESNGARDWASLANDGASVRYGWFMGQMSWCPTRLKRPTARPPSSEESARATVWLDVDQAQFLAKIADGPKGYRLIVDCVRGCIPRTRYVQDVPDAPISLFRLWDGDDLLFSVWAGGSAYRVRAWQVSRGKITQLLEASSRGRPDFLSAPDGTPVVRTYEADSGDQAPAPVAWAFRNGTFTRDREGSRGNTH